MSNNNIYRWLIPSPIHLEILMLMVPWLGGNSAPSSPIHPFQPLANIGKYGAKSENRLLLGTHSIRKYSKHIGAL
jgi:hypothetical protein